jgi:serine/threonine-protein phosphatase 2A regulatory subunit B'
VQCIITYLEKDPTVAEACINTILKYWPVTNPTKEIIFLNELEEVFISKFKTIFTVDI